MVGMRDIYPESNRNAGSLGCDISRWCSIGKLRLGRLPHDKDIQSVGRPVDFSPRRYMPPLREVRLWGCINLRFCKASRRSAWRYVLRTQHESSCL
jgi:hypothetical protein